MDEKQMIALLTSFKEEIIEAFDHRISLSEERFQHSIDLLVEGQQTQVERMDRSDLRLDGIEEKILVLDVNVLALNSKFVSLDAKVVSLDAKLDTVASDLRLHRRDTEAHHGVYRVKESDE